MPTFVWEGQDASGKKVKGELQAKDQQQVFNHLRQQKIKPNVKKIKAKGAGLSKEIKIPGMGAKVKMRDVVVFTRQFATMIDAGLPIVQGLTVLGSSHDNPAMKKALTGVKDKVENGGTLADGLADFPKIFDTLFVNMVEAGETGGILDIILERLAQHLEKMDNLKRQVKTAMIYPTVVVMAAGIVTSILLIFVIPTFAEMFADFGAALPAPTRLVMQISDFFVAYYPVIFGCLGGSWWMWKRFIKTDRGQEIMHPIFLKIPVFGDIIRKVAVSGFCRTLGTMLSSGVPILDALNICAKTAGNKVVENEITSVRESISQGKSLTEPLVKSQVFPPMVVQMINVGETTGALDAMLSKIADFYESEVENAVTAMKQLIEPIMILILGTLVGGLVVAMYLPIFKLGNVV